MLGILGTTALLMDGAADDSWGKPRERAVLATLVVHAGRVVPIDTLIRWAWPEDTPVPQNPIQTFYTYATRIRTSLQRLPSPPLLRAGQGGYRLDMDRSRIDHHRFRDLVAQARAYANSRQPKRVVEQVEQALRLWRGVPLADLSSEPARIWRAGVMRNEWLAAHVTMVEALLSLKRFDDAIVQLDDLSVDHPDDVNLANLRLTALYGQHRSTDAVAFYLATWRRLRDDGDEQAVQHLRRHHTALQAEHGSAHQPQPAVVPRQLPHARADFVGRRDLLAALDAAVGGPTSPPMNGVVILDGPGGVGKTALALHWAHQNRHRFAGGDLFVNLFGFSDRVRLEHATVVDDLLTALGHPPDRDSSPRTRELLLSSMLAGRHTLVVLDNARDTAHVRDLVSLLSSSLVLVTSRQRLSTLRTETGARRVSVRPMSAADATDMLAGQLTGRGQVADEHHARLAELCGGLPLLITLLAEHVADWSPIRVAEYSTQLDRRQLLVGIGDHGDGVANGEACFAQSYDALAEPDRRLFGLLALHPGPDISVAAAGACDGRTIRETAASLARLAGAHLLEAHPDIGERYRCHDLLAEFAAHRVERDELPETRTAAERRILSYFVSAATAACRTMYPSYNVAPSVREVDEVAVEFADPARARTWFDRERATLVAAVRQAFDHGHHHHCWRLADPLVTFFDRLGRNADARAVRELALRSARAAQDKGGEVSNLIGLGMGCTTLGDLHRAEEYFESALRLIEDGGFERAQASILHHLGRLAMLRGEPTEALTRYERGLDIAERIQDQEALCWLHCRIGHALRTLDRHEQALVHLHDARWLARQIGERSAEATSLADLGAVHRDMGELATAAGHCEQALTIAEETPDLAAAARICVVLCEINSARKQSRIAIRYGLRAVEVCRETQNLADQAHALEVLGGVQHSCGDLVDAELSWRQAADLYEHTGNAAKATSLRAAVAELPALRHDALPTPRRDGVGEDTIHLRNETPTAHSRDTTE